MLDADAGFHAAGDGGGSRRQSSAAIPAASPDTRRVQQLGSELITLYIDFFKRSFDVERLDTKVLYEETGMFVVLCCR